MNTIKKIDENLLLFIQENCRSEGWNPFWKIMTHLGDGALFWVLTALALMVSKKTRKIGVAAILSIIMGSLVTNVLLKLVVSRTRPYDHNDNIIPIIKKPRDYSFPSGHTTVSFACALVYLRQLPKKYGVSAAALAGLIGFSRLYLGVHYPTDILGGIMVAPLTSELTIRLLNKKQAR